MNNHIIGTLITIRDGLGSIINNSFIRNTLKNNLILINNSSVLMSKNFISSTNSQSALNIIFDISK